MKPKIIALSASLRNGRWGKGITELLSTIRSIEDKTEFYDFIRNEGRVHYENFIEAGRTEQLPFDELYKNLKQTAGKNGLCNSEIGMTAGLWAAHKIGCEIDYIALSTHFTPDGKEVGVDALKEQLLTADGLLLCSPVYFGDRSSLANDFIEFIRRDKDILDHLSGKPVAGISAGAKRNGGQETTLIYQLMDMTFLGMLGVGNDSETTSQYGGTIHAGDVGTAADDDYGLNTALGTGRRLARVMLKLSEVKAERFCGKLRVMFWILQDRDGYAFNEVQKLLEGKNGGLDTKIIDFTQGAINRCIACDICPVTVGADVEYRCIHKKESDQLVQYHQSFLDQDLIVPVIFSPKNRDGLVNVYQRFIERTRYLRRGDYLFGETPIMPLVFEEVGAGENMHIRMLTSLIRHHTIMLRRNIGFIHNGEILNRNELNSSFENALENSERITVGRLMATGEDKTLAYKPVGYILSAEKEKEISVAQRRKVLQKDRVQRRLADAKLRLTKTIED